MSKAIAVNTGKVIPLKPWGEANPQRGVAYMEHAVAFAKLFPPESELSRAQWDQFLCMRNLLTVPNEGPGTDTWMAHILRRNRLRSRINQAAQHPNITTNYGVQTYKIESAPRRYIVRPVLDVATDDDMGRYVEGKVKHKRKQLDIALQGLDLSALTPIERHTVEQTFTSGERLVNTIQFHVGQYLREMAATTKFVLDLKTKTHRIEP